MPNKNDLDLVAGEAAPHEFDPADDRPSESCTPPRALIQGDDFVMEGGLMVFSRAYHLRRGYCCGSDCRFCPYSFDVR